MTIAGVTVAISASPLVALGNLVSIAIWPTWVAVAVSETLRKVCGLYQSLLCRPPV